ncbi:uncharacterized protein CMU_006060 [Cryptosporidium muris RN66]|uniref:Uncharacterized protein n=1 Tax=Cryptosporidium muris (strain RN66) TaxID=441375 RepID=B6AHI8_CRYMR|nr:uncharacterized protein CMU_006060 [Cryptosporidium muris RN66]EEA07683.1 hypothetical protein, conserved [Cryptosporidium muris RN66]|eukprot:XP_002142032.1 hypothetical protein [Cryptosporidium muris RN66]
MSSKFIIYFLVELYIQMYKCSNIQMGLIFIDVFSLLNIKYENNSNSHISEGTIKKLFRISNNSKLISNNDIISSTLDSLEYRDNNNSDKYNMNYIKYENIKDFDKLLENKNFNNLKLLSPNYNTELNIKNITDKSMNLKSSYNLEDNFKPIEEITYFDHNYSISDNININTSNLINNSSNKFKFYYIGPQNPSYNFESNYKNESNIFGMPYVYLIKDNYRNESYPVCEIKSCKKFNEEPLIKEIIESNITKEFCKSNDLNGLFISNNISDLNSNNILIYNDINNSRFEISEIDHNQIGFRMLKQKVKKKKKSLFDKFRTTLKWFVCAETLLAGCACCLMITETCLIAVSENSNRYDMNMYDPYDYDPYIYPHEPIRVNNPLQNKDNIYLGINSRSRYEENKSHPIEGLSLLDILANI